MSAQNVGENGQQKAVGDTTCSLYLTSLLHGHLTFFSVLNSFLSVTAFLGNAVILIALHKESSLHPPSKLLLRSLATTDLCVGLIAEPLFVVSCMSIANEHWSILPYSSKAQLITSFILCGVSLLTLTAISVDRLLALQLGLRYRQVVTLKRTYAIVIAIWVVSTVCSAIQFWNHLITLRYGFIVTSLCLVISSFSYTKIFLTLRHHQNQVQDYVQQPNQTKKTEHSAIQKGSVHCNMTATDAGRLLSTLQYSGGFDELGGLSSSLCYAWIYTGALVYLNSSLNPILYCWKLEEVRQAVKDTIRQVICLCFSGQLDQHGERIKIINVQR